VKYLITPLIGLILALISFIVAPIGMLFAMWFIKWDATPSAGSYADAANAVTVYKIIAIAIAA